MAYFSMPRRNTSKFKPGDRVIARDGSRGVIDYRDDADTAKKEAYTVIHQTGEIIWWHAESLTLDTGISNTEDLTREDVLFAIGASKMPVEVQKYLILLMDLKS